MEYAEHPVPDDLQRYVQCLWLLRDDAPDQAIQTIYPDGRCELLAELGVPLRFHGSDGGIRADQPLCFAAQQLGPIRLRATGSVLCIGIRLMPACSGLIAGERLLMLRDQAPDLYTLDPAFAAAFRIAAQSFALTASAEPLWELLRMRCASFTPNTLAERAVKQLDSTDGVLRITRLASQLNVALRTLQMRFLRAVGLTPKEYARVRRLQALLRTLDAEHGGVADAATQHGYSDQAHATHELSRWTGTTPAKLARALRNDPDGESTLQLAAAFIRGTGKARTAPSLR